MSITNLTSVANSAARAIGVLDSGESLSAQQLSDALELANKIWDNWSSEQLQAPIAAASTQALLAGNSQYTVGPALTWNLNPGPVRITSAILIMSNGVQLPVRVVTSAEWDQIKDRGSSSNLIEFLFYTPTLPVGTGLAMVSAVPQSGGAVLSFQYWRPFTQFADTTTTITIPAGYILPFYLALAEGMASDMDVPWSQDNAKRLLEAMTRVRQLNAQLWGAIAAGQPAQAAA